MEYVHGVALGLELAKDEKKSKQHIEKESSSTSRNVKKMGNTATPQFPLEVVLLKSSNGAEKIYIQINLKKFITIVIILSAD